MPKSLREEVRRLLDETDVPLTTIASKSGVPHGALYHFHKGGGADMRSEYMEAVYTYLSGEALIEEEEDEG